MFPVVTLADLFGGKKEVRWNAWVHVCLQYNLMIVYFCNKQCEIQYLCMNPSKSVLFELCTPESHNRPHWSNTIWGLLRQGVSLAILMGRVIYWFLLGPHSCIVKCHTEVASLQPSWGWARNWFELLFAARFELPKLPDSWECNLSVRLCTSLNFVLQLWSQKYKNMHLPQRRKERIHILGGNTFKGLWCNGGKCTFDGKSACNLHAGIFCVQSLQYP